MSKSDQIGDKMQSGDAEVRRRAVSELPHEQGSLGLLLNVLADADWRVRKEAVARAARWHDVAAAVQGLIGVVRGADDVGWRNAAVDALSRIGLPAVEPLVAELARPGQHHKFIIDILGAIGEPKAVPALIESLGNQDSNLRIAAAEALRQIGGSEAKAALRQALQAPDVQLRLAALDGLALLHSVVPVELVAPHLDDVVLRKSALRLLGWSRSRGALQPLFDTLAAGPRSQHAAAAVALANLLAHSRDAERAEFETRIARLAKQARDHLCAVFAGNDPEARRAAAKLLGVAQCQDAVGSLIGGLSDPEVAESCAEALLGFGQDCIPALVGAAQSAEPELRIEIFSLLVDLGCAGADVEAVLSESLHEDADDLVAAAAARALGELAGDGVAGELAAAMREGERVERATAAATALGRMVARGVALDATRWLKDGLASPAAEVRAASALALGEIGGDAVIDLVASRLADPDTSARAAAIHALGMLGERGRAFLGEHLAREVDAEMVAAIRKILGDSSRRNRF